MGELAPVAPRERVVVLDVLRGFALLGVLLGNLYYLYSWRFAQAGPDRQGGVVDEVAEWFMALVVEGRAQTLLTLLFGFGFAMQLVRADARGERVGPIYARRVAALFALGWAHVIVLSWVDVTWGYAVAAVPLVLFVRASNRVRLVAAAVLSLIPVFVFTWQGPSVAVYEALFPASVADYTKDLVHAAASGGHAAIAEAHVALALAWSGRIVLWYPGWLLGRFLLGYVAGSRRWFEHEGAEHLGVFRRMLWLGAIATGIGTALVVLGRVGVDPPPRLLAATLNQVAVLGQTLMYVAIVVLLIQRPAWRRVLVILAPVGRMPLTTYLMQSLVCTALFYGWGLGWTTPGPAACVGLAFAIFGVQVAFSHLYFRRYSFGPAEWVWRLAVYGRAALTGR